MKPCLDNQHMTAQNTHLYLEQSRNENEEFTWKTEDWSTLQII